jgi:hypothetical protein
MTDGERWATLRDFLATERRAHHEIFAACDGADLAATRWEQGGIVQGLDRALAKMTGLEAGR